MRIVHTESPTGLGGRELAVLGIVEGLSARGHYTLLAVQPHSRLEQLAKERRIPVETLAMSKTHFPVGALADRDGARQLGRAG